MSKTPHEVHIYLATDEFRFIKRDADKNMRSLTAQVRSYIRKEMEANARSVAGKKP